MACPEGGSRNSKCGNYWEVSRSWEWAAHSKSNPGMASHLSEEKGPAWSQHRRSHCAHTVQGSPGICLSGRGWESDEWSERLLVPDYFIFLHDMPVLIGRQPDWELEAVGISIQPVGQVLYRAQSKQSEGHGKTSAWERHLPSVSPWAFLALPGTWVLWER